MEIITNIISAVLKAVVSNKVGNGLMKELVDISIGEVSEKSIEKIDDFICGEKSKIEYIFSKNNMLSMGIPEDNIEYVVAEIKDLLSWIEITDEIFRQCKYESSNLKDFLWSKYVENKSGCIECEDEIKRGLFIVAEALIKLMFASESFEKEILSRIDISVDNVNTEVQKISKYLEENIYKLDADNQIIFDILLIILRELQNPNNQGKVLEKKIQSRTQEYADKWNQNMFLNDFDKRDKNAGTNVKLREVYLDEHLPHYVWGNNKTEDTDLKELLTEYIEEKNENKMLLILGQPGIGKSTLITWITANYKDRIDDIIVYKFASDLKTIDWKIEDIAEELLERLKLSYNELNGKILILDGFDEGSIGINKKDILDKLYRELIYQKFIKNFTLIVTCRENYIRNFEDLECQYIILRPWNEWQIESFCTIFQRIVGNFISKNMIENAIENREVLGIPLILYMVLALNISFEKNGSIVDVYDKIFSLDGGIYDRCINNKRFAGIHRISELKKQIHQISREIAMWMFENNPDEAYIPQIEYQKICNKVIQEIMWKMEDVERDFLIGNFFKLKHCEGHNSEDIGFVHRSIYEYFVSETIYSSLEKPMILLSENDKEDFAVNIVMYLKQGRITHTISEYLQHKFTNLYNSLCCEKKEIFYYWCETVVVKMMKNGMLYYVKNRAESYKNILNKECRCFLNLLEILRLVSYVSQEKIMLKEVNRNQLERYIKHMLVEEMVTKKRKNTLEKNLEELLEKEFDKQSEINLSKICLCEIDLREMNLQSVDISCSDLQKANLSRVDLWNANLKQADLREINLELANLRRANLMNSDLRNANLKGADLNGANLARVKLRGANLKGADLSGINFSSINLDGIDLTEANISKATLNYAYLSHTNLKRAILNKTKLYKAILHGTRLCNSFLLWANLIGADLRGADLRGADLRGADLRNADLRGADLRDADLMFSKFDEIQITYITNCNLENALVYVKEFERFVDYMEYRKVK